MKIIGIQKENSLFYCAHVSLVSGKIAIDSLEKKGKSLLGEKKGEVATGIDGHELLVRHLVTPLKNLKALRKALPFQLEALLPYSLEDAVIKPLYEVGAEGTRATFFTTSKKNLYKHISQFQNVGVDPDWISAIPIALFRFATFACPREKSLIVFYAGGEKMQLASIWEGKISSHITIHLGRDDLSSKEQVKTIPKLKREVDRALCFLAQKEEGKCPPKILFVGEQVTELESLLQEELTHLERVDIEGKSGFSSKALLPYAVPIGLAIDALQNDEVTIQLRQETFIAAHAYRLMKKQIALGGIGALALFFAALFAFQTVYWQKEKKLMSQCARLFSPSEQRAGQTFYAEQKGKSLCKVVEDLTEEVFSSQKEKRIFDEPPRVADLLTFLSTHPALNGIEIREVHYQLQSYPSLRSPNTPYQPQVTLKFCSQEEQKMSALRAALIGDQVFIDRKKEIKWSRNEDEGEYEATFFLQA